MSRHKLLAEHRRMLGDFEVIDVIEEADIARLRDRLDVAAPIDLHWTWDYASEVGELRDLYEKGKKSQWNAALDVDWTHACPRDEQLFGDDPPLILPHVLRQRGADDATCREAAWDEFAHLCSQILHGEQAALLLSGQLTNVCQPLDGKLLASLQVVDEARHTEVVARLLQSKIGVLYPIDPSLKALFDTILAAPSWKAKVIGTQCVVEGVALETFHGVSRATTSPLLRDIFSRLHADEARHAAFGVLVVRQLLKESSPDERAEMEDFAFSVAEGLNANQSLAMLRLLGPKYGLDPAEVVESLHLSEGWKEDNSRLFMHSVVPNLRRLGLITERTEADWRRIGALCDAPDAANEPPTRESAR